jgi:hypothetical protein
VRSNVDADLQGVSECAMPVHRCHVLARVQGETGSAARACGDWSASIWTACTTVGHVAVMGVYYNSRIIIDARWVLG